MHAIGKSTSGEFLPAEPKGRLRDLLDCEECIERAQRNAYYEIGLALRTLRDTGVYKVRRTHPITGHYSFQTFEEYVEGRWEIDRRRAIQLIDAASVVEKMGTIVHILPSRESHVRPLLALKNDDERVAVWQAVVQKHGSSLVAKDVEAEVALIQAAKAKDWIELSAWRAMPTAERSSLLNVIGDKQFNKQDTASIEWAKWSWNPVTGCKHDCPYCYARDIADRFYPQKFEPSIYPSRLSAPRNTVLPPQAEHDVSFKNVFVCSMADLFGRWVPAEWIEAVLDSARKSPQWNFLFLTKFPKRLAEFSIPENAWMGTTVDCQARVKAAEDAFAKVKAAVKWLSIEPMLEPLEFKRLDLFNWMVLGGASKSTQTPEWRVPFDWWIPLHLEAKRLGLMVYHKDNLIGARELGFPTQPHVTPKAPPVPFIYLKQKPKAIIELGEE